MLQAQDNQIVEEATELFTGLRKEMHDQNKRITDMGLASFAQKVSIQALQKTTATLSKKIDDVTTIEAAITESLKQVPTKRKLQQHRAAMEEAMNSIAEVNTGLTTAMDQYKFSDSMPRIERQVFAGRSGTQSVMHPQRTAALESPSVSSLRDTGSEYSWSYRLRGGLGSEAAAGGAGDAPAGGAGDAPARGAGGGAANGAAGGAGGGGGPPPPPDPPPSDHGGHGAGRMSRRRR